MSAVLNWVKSNVYIVIFAVIMIVAPVVLTVVCGRMNAGVQQSVKDRAAKLSELKKLEKTSFTYANPVAGTPPVSEMLLINRQLLDRYREVAGQVRGDAEATREAALKFNRKDRAVMLQGLFPEPPVHLRETLPFEMYRLLVAAYARLLEDINAGAPPDSETVREELEVARDRERTQVLIKSGDEQLTDEDNAYLAGRLSKVRLRMYADTARGISLYATTDALDVPTENETPVRAEGQGLVDLFEWLWQYWIKQDIIQALAAANESSDSVIDAPVKRLIALAIGDAPVVHTAGGSAGGGGGGFGPSGAGGLGRRGAGSSGRAPAAGQASRGVAANPSAEVKLDFGQSFTGRTTNPLYDVRYAYLVVIVDTQRIPELFDALARQNFITVIDVQYDAVDAFVEAADGYFYGGGPVSRLTLQLETVWLREWTADFMPSELRQALGIPTRPAQG